MHIQQQAYQCLMMKQPEEKAAAVLKLEQRAREANAWQCEQTPARAVIIPGRPDKPHMISPKKVPRRGVGSTEGRAALYHALAHIEFNAINLGLDAVYRFADMPEDFYRDWLKVAAEEAFHFTLLNEHLHRLGVQYGDFPAHNGLWDMAVKTAGDVMARMALVPRVLEARGLDVTPGIIQKLRSVGDTRGVEILEVILRDEITHVAIGNRWFQYCCEARACEPLQTFRELLHHYAMGHVRGPFNQQARKKAGFTDQELHALKALERDFLKQLK